MSRKSVQLAHHEIEKSVHVKCATCTPAGASLEGCAPRAGGFVGLPVSWLEEDDRQRAETIARALRWRAEHPR